MAEATRRLLEMLDQELQHEQGAVIQQHAESNFYSVVRDYCGHGIGQIFHEDPQVLHYGKAGEGMALVEGMTFTIEPMINAGSQSQPIEGRRGGAAMTTQRKVRTCFWFARRGIDARGERVAPYLHPVALEPFVDLLLGR